MVGEGAVHQTGAELDFVKHLAAEVVGLGVGDCACRQSTTAST